MSLRQSDWHPTDEYLICRDLQHSWAPFTVAKVSKGFVRVLTCLRCHAKKEQHLTKRGHIMSTKMTYPRGYLRPSGGRLTQDDRAALRRELLT